MADERPRQRETVPFSASGWMAMDTPYGGDTAAIEARSLARPRFWSREGSGSAILGVFALAHLAAGFAGLAGSAIMWYLVQPGRSLPLVLGASALTVIAGLAAYVLARAADTRLMLIARGILPVVDLISAALILWATGPRDAAAAFFLLPVLLAALLFSWRAGAIFATLVVAVFGTICVLSLGLDFMAWTPPTAVIAIASGIVAAAAGVFWHEVERASDALLRERALLRDVATRKDVEKNRLIENISLMEDARVRLENERIQINAQIVELAMAAQRIAQGDTGAVRIIRPGLVGPLESLGGWLAQLAQQVNGYPALYRQAQAYHQALGHLEDSAREQDQTLVQTQRALHALAASANELVAQIQRLERGSGELPGIDRRVLFSEMQGIEQHALTQASDTAMLSARMQQLQVRQSAMRERLRVTTHLPGEGVRAEEAVRPPAQHAQSTQHATPATPATGTVWHPHTGWKSSTPGMARQGDHES